jgi:hypothetical protein
MAVEMMEYDVDISTWCGWWLEIVLVAKPIARSMHMTVDFEWGDSKACNSAINEGLY